MLNSGYTKNLKNNIWLKRAVVFFSVLIVGLAYIYWPVLRDIISGPATIVTNESTTEPTGSKGVPRPDLGPNTLEIEKLGLKVPVQYVLDNTEKTFQTALEKGVVHFPGSALAGQPGNVYIFGHSSDFNWKAGNYKTVFRRLPELEIGDSITLTDNQGNGYIYRVFEEKVVEPDDLSVLNQNLNKYQLTLQTSWPIGTAKQRYLVIAEIRDENTK